MAAFPHLVTMLPVSPKIPHTRHPSEAAGLNASNLKLLATPREEDRVQEFVASQTRYAKAQANEGRAVRASWYISTPEKDKMQLHQLSAGFETPVLRPRAVQSSRTEPPNHRPASQPHPNPTTNEPTPQSPEPLKKTKSTSAIRGAVSPKRQRTQANKSGTSNPIRKERCARSDTDEEHLASVSSFFLRSQRWTETYGFPRAYRTTGAQTREAGNYEPRRSQSGQKEREGEQS